MVVPSSPGMIPETVDSLPINRSNPSWRLKWTRPPDEELISFPVASILGTIPPLGASQTLVLHIHSLSTLLLNACCRLGKEQTFGGVRRLGHSASSEDGAPMLEEGIQPLSKCPFSDGTTLSPSFLGVPSKRDSSWLFFSRPAQSEALPSSFYPQGS